ncbi:nucleoside deaminase [Actinoplanes sp. DH11]|uniref:nucleoside deaminase n=1 Tax=Actinoplanes sp. DH11 TaxID=2857011 RepID=UPI001E409B61|nr:nucleoside deaminase [Actinoplanes sp. DH11]
MTPVTSSGITAADETHLERAVALARDARDSGDEPFGSLLVTPGGEVLEAVNNIVTAADPTGHAETNLVRLAGRLDPAVRAGSVLYTSTEPCAMCAGAIYWSGIGRIVFALSSEQLGAMIGKPALRLSSREVFERGARPIVIDGPAALRSATEVHAGFWN